MNTQQILKRLRGGFRPFVIRTSDGKQYPVPHPEFIAVGKFAVAVVDKKGFIDNLDPLQVVSIQDAPAPTRRT